MMQDKTKDDDLVLMVAGDNFMPAKYKDKHMGNHGLEFG